MKHDDLRVEKLSATVLGIGYLPIAPGTWASLVAVLVWSLIHLLFDFSFEFQILFILAAIALGVWSSIKMEQEWGDDPSQIVIDEWAGMWITCFLLPATWINFLIAFVVFRILDIWKPLFIGRAEKIKGGWGVMLDDILAGITGNILILTFLIFFNG